MKYSKKSTVGQKRAKPNHYQIRVLKERCKGCQFCIEFCPQKALIQSTEINSHGYHVVCLGDDDKCTGCNMCSMVCPEFAINVIPIKEGSKQRR
jgi:2-oxoglutarate ferredoxin oxidoreductase subunit delta